MKVVDRVLTRSMKSGLSKEDMAQVHVMQLRMTLHQLNIIKLPDSFFDSIPYIKKHSPSMKKKV